MKIACLSLKVGNCQWDFGVGSFRGDTKCQPTSKHVQGDDVGW